MHVDEGPVVVLDRWQINVWPNESIPRNPADAKDTVDNVPIHVVNNYFSIGADAQVALDFHLGRGMYICIHSVNVYVLSINILEPEHF